MRPWVSVFTVALLVAGLLVACSTRRSVVQMALLRCEVQH